MAQIIDAQKLALEASFNSKSKFAIRISFGARGEIRTRHKADLKSAASSNWATRAQEIDNVDGTGGGI